MGAAHPRAAASGVSPTGSPAEIRVRATHGSGATKEEDPVSAPVRTDRPDPARPTTDRPTTGRPGLAVAVAGWSTRHRRSALGGWLLFVVLATTLGAMAGSVATTSAQDVPGESGRALTVLEEAGLSAPAAETVLVHSDALTTEAASFRAAVDQLVTAVSGTGVTADVRSPYDSGAFSTDRHSAVLSFTIAGDPRTAVDRVPVVLDAVKGVQAQHPDVVFAQSGQASGEKAFDELFTDSFARAEWTAVPLALGILIVVFGALVAAVLPVALALTAFTAAAGLVMLSSHLIPTTPDASSVMLLVGLAVGVDYSLFYLHREREERAAGRDPESALQIAAATSGRAVLVSGLTVVVAMSGMFFTGIADFTAIAVATVLVVLIAVAGSVTVLPAALSLLGTRVDRGRVPFLGRRARGRTTIGSGLLPFVLKRPGLAAALSAVALIVLAAPVLGMRTAQLTVAQELPSDNAMVQVQQRTAAALPGAPVPATVVVTAADVEGSAVRDAVAGLRARVADSGIASGGITTAAHPQEGLLVLQVPLVGSGNDRASTAALTTLRGTLLPATLGAVPGAEVLVTGPTASSVDFNGALERSIVPVIGLVLLMAFLVMLLSFRSAVIATTTVALNLLSVGAAYGALTLVFQHGVGASLVGTESIGVIAAWIPLFLFVILFGLSMDYHVFVVSRIVEGHRQGLSTRAAITEGVRATAGVVTAAALIMVAVFAVFGTLSVQSMKQVGVGLAVAVLIDATVIRAVLLPAVMILLGDRNWHEPRWLRRVPGASRPVAVQAAVPVQRSAVHARELVR